MSSRPDLLPQSGHPASGTRTLAWIRTVGPRRSTCSTRRPARCGSNFQILVTTPRP